ncbi:DUF4435 domain-containing protein [Burkholderia cepacia]|uniref:DUF4435 domain-containing protein n=1 Tax=Burkholderia cepacia TaxID=292 RepID=UPI0009BEF7FF|nr:DUF4435 domain-containing protein [Burkholderia cepacia]RQT83738.1 DUF4435 domain-containing protein [Burkholderia cepacia]RQU03403.1 DUF4435 domain-containing protein [Burkholderia cepacia]RQZ79914.1 DUF4435 domain-containing protein [Burkholderia cepacia]RRA02107.1 DUF4435 domain-containing protein [Burkholderia cepacia]RRA05303.1 DUF4435 domain-containing protein [Burkholderia cepacia]
MSYVDDLRADAHEAHSVFHEFILALADTPSDAIFAFYEGEEDASFYAMHIINRATQRDLVSFICNGRAEVLKANELVLQDGRATDRALFFVDKDHTDILNPDQPPHPANVFQTRSYSIENYLVSDEVFRQFWVQRLHLSILDPRLNQYLERFRAIRKNYFMRSRILMAIVLFGRGIDGRLPVKLNLNNVQLDKVVDVNFETNHCAFENGAGRHFLAATNIHKSGKLPTSHELRQIYRLHLKSRDPGCFVRGKYELWFFWKVLIAFTRELSDRDRARASGCKRATPSWTLSLAGCVEALASLLQCPPELALFLQSRIVTA